MNRNTAHIVPLTSILLLAIGVAAGLAGEDDSPAVSQPATEPATQAATQKKPAAPIPTVDALLNQMPKNIWPDPKGNPIREEANETSRERWIKANVLNKEVKLTGYVGSISREQALIMVGVYTENKGTTSISSSNFAIEIHGRTDERITIWGQKNHGPLGVVCVPKLLRSGNIPIEPLLALNLSQRVTVTGTVDTIDVVDGGFRLTLSGCQFKK